MEANLERIALIEKVTGKKIDHWRIEGTEFVVIFADYSKQRFPLEYNPITIETEETAPAAIAPKAASATKKTAKKR